MIATCMGCYCIVAAFPSLLRWLGLRLFQWGLDAHALLAAADTAAAGGNVYAPMSLDPLNRVHSYSTWWLKLGDLGLTRAELPWFAAAIVILFLVAMFWRLQPRNWTEAVLFTAAACSTPVIYGLIRANNDLIVFTLLSFVVPCLLRGAAIARWGAPLLITLAAGLKYYPAVAGLMLLEPTKPAQRLRTIVIFACGGAVALWSIWPDLASIAIGQPYIAEPFSLGAMLALRELQLSEHVTALVCIVAIAVASFISFRWRAWREWSPPLELRADYLQFILGAALLTGCFWAGPSFGYRWIFALWFLPFLVRIREFRSGSSGVAKVWRLLMTLLWPLLFADTLVNVSMIFCGRVLGWEPPIDRYIFTLLIQPLAWFYFGLLTMCLSQFVFSRLASIWRERPWWFTSAAVGITAR